jgi:hypothetical protein
VETCGLDSKKSRGLAAFEMGRSVGKEVNETMATMAPLLRSLALGTKTEMQGTSVTFERIQQGIGCLVAMANGSTTM